MAQRPATTPPAAHGGVMDERRRSLLAAALLAPLAACGGGGGGGDAGGGGGGGGGTARSGRIVVKESGGLWVIDAATGSATSAPAASSTYQPGVGVSRSGLIGDVWDYNGGASSTWRIAFRTLAFALTAEWRAGTTALLSTPGSAAVLNAEATRAAYAVNEMTSAANGTRINRTYVNDTASGSLLARIDNFEEPAFLDTGELLLRTGTTLHVFDTQLRSLGALPMVAPTRPGGYAGSPNGRYIAYENGSRISVLDRSTGTSFDAVALSARSASAPVFSPDGAFLAFLREGTLARSYVTVIPFVPGTTRTVSDSDTLTGPGGATYAGLNRIGWSR